MFVMQFMQLLLVRRSPFVSSEEVVLRMQLKASLWQSTAAECDTASEGVQEKIELHRSQLVTHGNKAHHPAFATRHHSTARGWRHAAQQPMEPRDRASTPAPYRTASALDNE